MIKGKHCQHQTSPAQNITNCKKMATPLEIVTAGNQRKIDAFTNSDHVAMGNAYTENCRTMAPKKPVIHGREATAAFFKKGMEAGLGNLALKTDEVEQLGEKICERGTFSFLKKDGTLIEEGKYVTIWKQVDGVWYNDIDIWNINC